MLLNAAYIVLVVIYSVEGGATQATVKQSIHIRIPYMMPCLVYNPPLTRFSVTTHFTELQLQEISQGVIDMRHLLANCLM